MVSMRFSALETVGLTTRHTPTRTSVHQHTTTHAKSLPLEIFRLIHEEMFSLSALEMILDFHSWLQAKMADTSSHCDITWTSASVTDEERQFERFDSNSTAETNPTSLWRPHFIPSASLTNFEKLVILTLISLSETVIGVKDWSLWKINYDTWIALLNNSFDADDLHVRHCVIWCITVILSSTEPNVVSKLERRQLIHLAQTRFQTQEWPEAELERSLKQYYWIPQDLSLWLNLWRSP